MVPANAGRRLGMEKWKDWHCCASNSHTSGKVSRGGSSGRHIEAAQTSAVPIRKSSSWQESQPCMKHTHWEVQKDCQVPCPVPCVHGRSPKRKYTKLTSSTEHERNGCTRCRIQTNTAMFASRIHKEKEGGKCQHRYANSLGLVRVCRIRDREPSMQKQTGLVAPVESLCLS